MTELKSRCNQLWQSFVSGDETAFHALYELTYNDLFRYGKSLIPGADTIRDLMQEAYLSLWRQGEKKTEIRDVRVYLLVTFRNRLVDLKRKEKRQLPELDLELPSAEDELLEEEKNTLRRRWLKQELEELPDRQREAIHLRYKAEMDYDDISSVLGVSVQVAYNYVNRGINKLRDRWADAPEWL